MSADSPSHPGPSLGTVQELRSLAAALRGVDAATAAAEWGDDAALRVAARTAAGELASLPHIALTDGGDWAAFALVLLSALTSWALPTVFAAACGREPRLRGLLSREMVPYRAS
ncbi:hypothetical protein [Mycolicibacterium brisbanense]|uniref:Uncharacterized protein n=1 Tax=Mycolicibacterium brisbanense TaxID=146020 RepID=A0A117I8B8_9MYCO|nr:hypothetical protein [Mycolicibacterium brisbanense]GAS92955.1 uncharacterized protein RMCB_7051 [Mycolicibacterium brisbanense]